MLQRILRYIRLNILSVHLRYPLKGAELIQPPPVFILSAGRSGSTLLRKILLRTSQISIPPETHGLIPALRSCFLQYNHLAWPELIDRLINLMNHRNYLFFWDLPISKEDILYLKYQLKDQSLAAIIHFLYQQYAHKYHQGAYYWGDKTPLLTKHVDLLNDIFPEARYVFLIRDGRDVISSFLHHNLYTDINYLCDRWIQSVKVSRRLFKKKGKGYIYIVHYEKLVNHAEEEMISICNFLNIPFSPDCLSNRPVYMGDDSQAHFISTEQTIHYNHVGKWIHTLTEEQKKQVIKRIGFTLRSMGYH